MTAGTNGSHLTAPNYTINKKYVNNKTSKKLYRLFHLKPCQVASYHVEGV